ncbi:MAG: ABC transporter substrate-binding protein [Candidatus Accumulibacter sp.]|jgi:iron complex transport system substrate-binding protein|nr:ABC transporter substrate-binding protein [Accumulibacter sp.]
MKKQIIAALVIALTVFSGCENDANRTDVSQKEFYWTEEHRDGEDYIVDRYGNRVVLREYRRVVVISPGAVETLYMIGGENVIAAIPSVREGIWPEEKTALLPRIGNTARPDIERIIALEPDLIIGNTMTGAAIGELSRRGYPAVILGAESLEDILRGTLVLGTFSGRRATAEALVAETRERLAAIRHSFADDPLELKGAFLYSTNPIMAFTGKSLPGEILELFGVENIAPDGRARQAILSPEYILAKNPDFLFCSISIKKPEDLLSPDSVILKTRAGREKNIIIVPTALFLRTSPRIVDYMSVLKERLTALRQPAQATPSSDP